MNAAETQPNPDDRATTIYFILAALLALTVVRSAWVGDDSYFTWRTIDNWVEGHGLTWNVGVRVQAFTHPLWMLVLTPFYLIIGDAYIATLVASFACTAAFVGLMFGYHRGSLPAVALAMVVLVSSKAFNDYSTSGLENPLTHALLALFFAIAWVERGGRAPLGWLSFIAALLILNRFDLSLIVLPTLLLLYVRQARRDGVGRSTGRALLGGLPLALWLLFATWYYGSPFPNTAYAKLSTGVDRGDLYVQGVMYVADSLSRDPVTLMIIGFTALCVVRARDWRLLPALIGGGLYLAYTVRIGGDFMSGRFFTPVLALAALILARQRWSPIAAAAPAGLVLIIGLTPVGAPLAADGNYGSDRALREDFKHRGIADERAAYYPYSGLLALRRTEPWPRHSWAQTGRDVRDALNAGDGPKMPLVRRSSGFYGFFAGPEALIIDIEALSDPLLARLPLDPEKEWRIGHFRRHVPAGYRESLRDGENRIRDEDLARYYDALHTITRGDLYSARRLRVIAGMLTGRYDEHLARYAARRAAKVRAALARKAEKKRREDAAKTRE